MIDLDRFPHLRPNPTPIHSKKRMRITRRFSSPAASISAKPPPPPHRAKTMRLQILPPMNAARTRASTLSPSSRSSKPDAISPPGKTSEPNHNPSSPTSKSPESITPSPRTAHSHKSPPPHPPQIPNSPPNVSIACNITSCTDASPSPIRRPIHQSQSHVTPPAISSRAIRRNNRPRQPPHRRHMIKRIINHRPPHQHQQMLIRQPLATRPRQNNSKNIHVPTSNENFTADAIPGRPHNQMPIPLSLPMILPQPRIPPPSKSP